VQNKFRLLAGLFLSITICISNGAVFADDGSTPEDPTATPEAVSNSCDGFDCTQPEAQDDWDDGDAITAQMYFDDYPANQDGATMEDKSDPNNTQFEVECADPDAVIYVGTSAGSPVEHQLTITSPDSPQIQALFGEDAIYDVRVGVNVSEEEGWDDAMEKYVYWSLLGYNVSLTAEQQSNADLIRSGTKDTILRQIDILFLMPENIDTKQLTFIKVCAEKVGGCTDPTASNYSADANFDDGICFYPVEGCTDPNASNYDPSANVENGTCTYVYGCMNPDAFNYNPDAGRDDGSCILGDDISLGLDPYCVKTGDSYSLGWEINNDNPFSVAASWSLNGAAGSGTLAPNSSVFVGYSPDGPQTSTLNVSWSGGSASLSSSHECDSTPPTTTTTTTRTIPSPVVQAAPQVLIPVTGVDQRSDQSQWMVQGLILLVGITLTISGLRKKD